MDNTFTKLHMFGCVLIAMVHFASGDTIDEILASSLQSVDETDVMADLTGNVVRWDMDMLLTRSQMDALKFLQKSENKEETPQNRRQRRKAIRDVRYRWPQKVIPYTIARSPFSESDRSQIMQAINEWSRHTCIVFRQANSNDQNKIHFDNGDGCSSYVGRIGGSQPISLARGCRFKGTIVHEIGHAVGFHHEQNRPDRDDYVTIRRENVIPSLYFNFEKYPTSVVDTMGVPYDYTSVMHYGSYAFSQNGMKTIVTKNPDLQSKIGNRKGLSFNDIMLANKMYSCDDGCDKSIQCPRGAFLGKDCSCWCPGYPIKKCDATGTVPTTTTIKPTEGSTKNPCRDLNLNCKGWAKAGYCSTNDYVKTYCKESCRTCDNDGLPTTKPPCLDRSRYCEIFGSRGYCTGRFEGYMNRYCAKTCKVCKRASEQGVDGNNSANIPNGCFAFTVILAVFVGSGRYFA